MPTYRVYYVSYPPEETDDLRVFGLPRREDEIPKDYQTDWEEDVEASDYGDALRIFFQGHLEEDADLGCLGEDGSVETVSSNERENLDAERPYLWVEGDKLMEYRQAEELGDLLPCPVCGGSGRLPAEKVAELKAQS